MSDYISGTEGDVKFKDFSHIPGITPEGVNKDSGFKVGQQNTTESIQKLTHINGLTLSELQTRMRPKQISGLNAGVMSYEGFLGENETLIQAMIKANEIVIENGYTHQDLASWLDTVVSANSDPKLPRGNQGKKFQMNGMDLEVYYLGTVSKGQDSPFKNDSVKTDEVGWDGSYYVKNLTTGRQLDFTPQISRWIKKWGFYEGFESSYCVNPQDVIDIFNKTDRVYKTRDEYITQKTNEFKSDGWKAVLIGHPNETTRSFPQTASTLKVFGDDFDGEEKISQILSDENFIVATNGQFTQFRRYENRLGIFKKQSSEVLVKCSVFGDYKITREVKDGFESVNVKVFENRSGENKLAGEVTVNTKPDKNGWTAYHTGDPNFIGDYSKYLSQFGLSSYSSEDDMSLFKSPNAEFLIQKQYDRVICFYKIDHRTGLKQRVPLTSDALKTMGVIAGSNDVITDILDVRVDAKGLVKGRVFVNNKTQEFSM